MCLISLSFIVSMKRIQHLVAIFVSQMTLQTTHYHVHFCCASSSYVASYADVLRLVTRSSPSLRTSAWEATSYDA